MKSARNVCIPYVAGWILFTGLTISGCADPNIAKQELAQSQVRRIVADLDARTTATGSYVRVEPGEIQATDPWGTPVEVSYTQGGIAEVVAVRSAGPDREFHTNDDIMAQGMAANLKGIGEGIKQGAEETAANVAKGVVKGTVAGIKESVADVLPFKKKSEKSDESSEEQPSEPAPN